MSVVQRKRAVLVLSLVLGIGTAIALILYALSQNINLFYTPTELRQLSEQKLSQHKSVRVGGMVVKDSVIRQNNLGVEFTITDFQHTLIVRYEGILPDLFREGQGIVALGVLDKEGHFKASQILAKHDEKYMPPEIAKMMAQKESQKGGG